MDGHARAMPAFSAIELLVVVVLLAVVLSLLMPTLAAARESARNAQCMSHLRTLVQGVHVYALNNKDMLPTCQGWGPALHWQLGLIQFAGFSKPRDWAWDTTMTEFHCPSIHGRIAGYGGYPAYSYNAYLSYQMMYPTPGQPHQESTRLRKIRHPDKAVTLHDSQFYHDPPMTWITGFIVMSNGSQHPGDPGYYHGTSTYTSIVGDGNCNFALIDGHVRTLNRSSTTQMYHEMNLLWDADNDRSAPLW